MSPTEPAIGRRDAQKARTQRAIIDAAVALTSRSGLSGLTVDTIAELADVSRRTVFNHFATLDDIVVAACLEVLDVLVDGFTEATRAVPPAGQTRAALFDDVARAVRDTDLVGPMAYLSRALDPAVQRRDPRAIALVDAALRRTGEHLVAEMTRRYPQVPALDVQLVASGLLSGITVLHHEWRARTGAADDAASRRTWESLLDHLLGVLRDGYATP